MPKIETSKKVETQEITLSELQEMKAGMMHMYKQGFVDGFMERMKRKGRLMTDESKAWKLVRFACMNKFDERFVKNIKKAINDDKDKGNRKNN